MLKQESRQSVKNLKPLSLSGFSRRPQFLIILTKIGKEAAGLGDAVQLRSGGTHQKATNWSRGALIVVNRGC